MATAATVFIVSESYLGRPISAREALRRSTPYIGRILIVSSISAFRPYPGIAIYSASKRYLFDLADALRHELLPWGVTVTCLAPGAVATGLYESRVDVNFAKKTGVMVEPALVTP